MLFRSNPGDYARVARELRANAGKISLQTRFELARAAFAHTAEYDRNIAGYLQKCDFNGLRGGYQIAEQK